MLDELGEHCRVGDVVSTFDAGGAALFAAPSGRVQLSVYPSFCLKGLMHDE